MHRPLMSFVGLLSDRSGVVRPHLVGSLQAASDVRENQFSLRMLGSDCREYERKTEGDVPHSSPNLPAELVYEEAHRTRRLKRLPCVLKVEKKVADHSTDIVQRNLGFIAQYEPISPEGISRFVSDAEKKIQSAERSCFSCGN